MPELPKDTPEHIRDTMTIILANLALEAEKTQLTIQQVIRQMRAAGTDLAEIERVLITDLREGGQIFGDFRKNFKSQMRYGLEQSARGEVFAAHAGAELWDWVEINDGKLCEDCSERGRMGSKPLDFWRSIGLPGSGTTICQEDCRCGLAPAGSLNIPEGGISRKKK